VIELDEGSIAIDAAPLDLTCLHVRAASDAELAAHEAVLDGIDLQCKAGAVWRRASGVAG